TRCLSVG
ncbi:putative aBC-type multidrug efflux pump, partial [Vibrio parahaemolyticus V-223/04]